VSISLTTDVLSAELLQEEVVPLCACEHSGQPDEAPVSAGYADDEDQEDEDQEDEDLDDLDEDEDEEEDDDDEELDDGGLDHEWEEVADEDEDEEDDE
jgi:hypothetical protein